MIDQYEKQLSIREDFFWITKDNGAWSGPRSEWQTGHSKHFFSYLKQTNVVVTAGANCGMYANYYSKQFQTVYAFEPESLNFYCFVRNTQTPNVIKFNAALGDKCQIIDIVECDNTNAGMHEVRLQENDTLEYSFTKNKNPKILCKNIPMLTIDTLNLNNCDLIQLDIQGSEFKALLGSENTIKKFHPVIALEYGNDNKQIVDYLTKLGYRLKLRSGLDDIFVYAS